MNSDEQRELEYRIRLLEMAGTHCGVNATDELVLSRAETYLAFAEAGRELATDKKGSKL